MNRLVLIGNGFDLAHGLNTRYEHFIVWYWEQKINEFVHKLTDTLQDKLCTFKLLDGSSWSSYVMSILRSHYPRPTNIEVIQYIFADKQRCKITPCPFFANILQSIVTKNWVDIENEYYSLLRQRTSPIRPSTEQDIKDLNINLNTLQSYLINYLRKEEEKGIEIKEGIKGKIYRPIMKDEIAVTNQRFSGNRLGDSAPSSIMLLNFNYTKTPELYLTDSSKVRINYIHGNLNNPQSIIFGYGDELDDDYKKIQNLNENECLRHIKSIKYLEADNYRKMLEFVESSPFQIVIMGHSCGNSDRTLLNTLFEHKNCVSIKPYYYKDKETGKDNYLELVQNISRNFKDMKLMRDRVVNKTFTEPLTLY